MEFFGTLNLPCLFSSNIPEVHYDTQATTAPGRFAAVLMYGSLCTYTKYATLYKTRNVI